MTPSRGWGGKNQALLRANASLATMLSAPLGSTRLLTVQETSNAGAQTSNVKSGAKEVSLSARATRLRTENSCSVESPLCASLGASPHCLPRSTRSPAFSALRSGPRWQNYSTVRPTRDPRKSQRFPPLPNFPPGGKEAITPCRHSSPPHPWQAAPGCSRPPKRARPHPQPPPWSPLPPQLQQD